MKLKRENKFVKIIKNDIPKRVLSIGIASTIMLSLPGCTILRNDLISINYSIYKELENNEINKNTLNDFKIVYYYDNDDNKCVDMIWTCKDSISILFKSFVIKDLYTDEYLFNSSILFPDTDFNYDDETIYRSIFGRNYSMVPSTIDVLERIGIKETYTKEELKIVIDELKQELEIDKKLTK